MVDRTPAMSVLEEFSGLVEWLQFAGFLVGERDGALWIDDADEVRWTVTRNGEWIVRKTWRDQDRGEQLITDDRDDVDRYFTLTASEPVRKRHGLPRREYSDLHDELGRMRFPDGFSFTERPDGDFVLRTPSGHALRIRSDAKAAEIAYFYGYSPDGLRERLLATTG